MFGVDCSSSEGSGKGSPFRHKLEEMPTRHPTTNKKKEKASSSFRRTNHSYPALQESHQSPRTRPSKSQHLRQSIITLQDEKNRCMETGRYSQAVQFESRITRARSLLGRDELRQLQKNHKRQKKSIKTAYEHEVVFFQSAWENYFSQYKEQQQAKVEYFRQQQAEQIQRIREKLRRKCGSLRYPSREVMELEKQEKYHLNSGNITELMLVRREKKKLVSQIKVDRKELISKWTQMEGNELERFQSKRYSILVERLQEKRQDQETAFLAQKKRLRQKYKNILGQLRHEQRMTVQFVTRRQTEA